MENESKLPTQLIDEKSSIALPEQTDAGLLRSTRSLFLEPFRKYTFRLGLVLLILSASIFGLYELFVEPDSNDGVPTFLIMVHYGITLSFAIHLQLNGFFKTRQEAYDSGRPARWVGLLLWLISAYALNRNMAVFQQSTQWLCWALVVVGLAIVGFAWKESLSVRGQQGLYALLAFGWCLFAYMAVYIVGLYLISVPLLIGLGLSIHTFVPLAFAIALGKRLWQDAQREEHLRLGIFVGLGVPVVVVTVFLTGWIQTEHQLDQMRQQVTVRKTSDLPDWVLIAQQLKPGWITNRLLLSDRVYDRGRFMDGAGGGLAGLTALDDVRQHDPLVVIASRLFPPATLANTEQLSIIKTLLSERHGTEEKFWTGRHLTTEEVVAQVRIWPQFRLSYTEQTIRIRNQAHTTTEEALLTFHLSPGSVVSSMALWVNGKEEPAYLTTVAKADSAYRTVVAVESRRFARDPSVVYWQEGNQVTVRVFPCLAGEDRRVKLGITSPLRLDGDQLVYQNPNVEGPNPAAADELINIVFDSIPTDLHSPWLLDRLTGSTLTHQGPHQPNWSMRFQAPPLSTEAFVLDGQTYHLEPYHPAVEPFNPTDVFLDINGEWTVDEVKATVAAASQIGARSWVFVDGLQPVTRQNLDAVYQQLKSQSFSLFPVYRIAHPATSLFVTKGTAASPLLADLRGSRFADHFGLLTRHTTPIRTFCLNSVRSPYVKSLAELQVLNVVQGTSDELTTLLVQNRPFPQQPTEPDRIVLSDAGVAIRQAATTAVNSTQAPDHLARLFAYNHLLRQIGRQYFVKNYQTDTLIQEAQRAHVVSPLSSLIVLESAADYNRFGINKDFSGLTNATLKEEGAVPEPHEWAMLVMILGLIGWLTWRKRYAIH